MPRVSSAVPRRKRVKRILKAAKGAFGARSKRLRAAKETVMRAGDYARAGRRIKKRDFRSLWITRISAACMTEGITYSRLIHGLKLAEINLNRKMLAELAIHDPVAFSEIVKKAKEKLSA